MPEFPDITIYIERLRHFVGGRVLERVRLGSPFVLRTAVPPLDSLNGLRLNDVERMGKRIVFRFEDDYSLILHLMIAGRLLWCEHGCKIPAKKGLAALDFPNGSILLTEVATKKRASLHVVKGEEELRAFDPGGIEVFEITFDEFRDAIMAENHTLKRTLTDPHILSGIGNAYSDEILHRAQLSPVTLTQKLKEEEAARLFDATREILTEWTERLRAEVGDGFPKKVTAFREEMAVHGRYGLPCPVCGNPVQRIRYSTNETNYCPECQTGGKLLADRALSRLLRKDWPRTLEEMEERRRPIGNKTSIE